MTNPNDPIKKVRISDVEKPQDGVSDKELDNAQLDKVSGGGGYYCPSCGSAQCSCGA